MTRVADQGLFDYVVVGAGAAGAIVASRLAGQGKQVCLLEAGPADRNPWLHVPAGFIKVLGNPRYTWPFVGEPSPGMERTGVALPQGRTLGGSTAINGMVYNRGHPQDYDEWAALGNPGWSYADVLGHFQRTEAALGLGEDRFRGRQGGLKVTPNDWLHPVCEAFIDGAAELGIPRNADYNGASQAGTGYYQRTIFKGWRMSSARAFMFAASALDGSMASQTLSKYSIFICHVPLPIACSGFSPVQYQVPPCAVSSSGRHAARKWLPRMPPHRSRARHPTRPAP